MKQASKKLRIRKSVSNRFEVTKNGTVLHQSSFNRHLRRKKSKKQLRRLKGKQPVLGRFAKKIKQILGKSQN
jgi:ribosomal protein L35